MTQLSAYRPTFCYVLCLLSEFINTHTNNTNNIDIAFGFPADDQYHRLWWVTSSPPINYSKGWVTDSRMITSYSSILINSKVCFKRSLLKWLIKASQPLTGIIIHSAVLGREDEKWKIFLLSIEAKLVLMRNVFLGLRQFKKRVNSSFFSMFAALVPKWRISTEISSHILEFHTTGICTVSSCHKPIGG